MKRLLFSAFSALFSLHLVLGQSIPVGYIPVSHRSDWQTSGVNVNNPPASANVVFDIDDVMAQTGLNLQQALNDVCLEYARNNPTETVLITFRNRVYVFATASGFTEALDIDVSNVTFQGVGSGTVIKGAIDNFPNGNARSIFRITGSVDNIPPPSGPGEKTLNTTFLKGTNTISVSNTNHLSINDWVHIHIKNFHESTLVGGDEEDTWPKIGQISRITALTANSITLEDEANMTFEVDYGFGESGVLIETVVKKINPVVNVGFENFKIMRGNGQYADDGVFEGYHFDFDYATNCWVRGVELVKPARAHINIDKSARIEVSGCYFNDALHHAGQYGYGVILENSTSKCLIENNIFRRLRHSILLQAGANGNVISFNYSREGYWIWSPVENPREIVFHGFYSFSNLVEHNMVTKMGPDDWNHRNGPFNAIVRNRIKASVEADPVPIPASLTIQNAYDLSLLGNIVYFSPRYYSSPPYSVAVDLFGNDKNSNLRDHRTANNEDVSKYTMEDISYFYSSLPPFATGYTWPAIGPRTTSVTPGNDIPANSRFHGSNVKTFIANLTPHPTPKSNVVISNSFDGGNVKVDNITQNSGGEFSWDISSTHTVEAYDQDWPQTNNLYRRFSNWVDPYGAEISTQQYTFSVPVFNCSYVADFDTRLNIDLDIVLINGGSGGSLTLNDSLIANLPYSGQYFAKDYITLQADEFTEIVNGISVDYFLSHWSNETTDNPYTMEANAHVDLMALMKGNKVANSENATVGNNSPKIATHPSNDNLHLVYIDNGKLYYSNSLDGGSNWTKDIYLDGASSEYSCQYPSVGVDANGNVHIVYEREYDDGSIKDYTVQYIEIDYFTETGVNRTEIGGFADNAGGYQFSTIPSICVRYYGDVYVAWRRSYNNIGTPDGKLVVRHKDVLGNWSTHKDVPNTDLDCVSPTLSYGDIAGSGFLHVFWVDTQSDRVYYANPTSQWNWGTSANLTSGISTISDFKNTSVHQSIGSYPDNIYLVWEGIEEFAGETKTGRPTNNVRDEENIKTEEKRSFSMGCPPATPDNPIIYFQEHDGSGWTGQTIFRINNTCDRKPVATSWETASGRQAMIAYENLEGRVATILRNENGQWASPTQITSNGTNPSLTNAGDSEPNLIYTRHSTNPHEIQFENNLLPPPSAPGATNPSITVLPHSRIVRVNLETDLLGGSGLGIKGDAVIEIGDLEISTNQGAQKVSPQYNDSLITPNNIFEYNDILLSEVNTLEVPVSIKAFGLSYQENRDSSFLPLLNLKLHDAVTHNILKDIKLYTTDIFGNNTNYREQDTIEVDLNNISSTTLYIRGEVFLKDNTWKADVAEVFDLRNVQVDTLRKGILATADDKLPKVFALYQNYPNPFNPSTTIRFDLPKNVKVKIKIYDIQGRLVDILVNKSMKAGTHEVAWNGRSRAGYRVASGLYFYRIQAGNFTRVKKMLIIK